MTEMSGQFYQLKWMSLTSLAYVFQVCKGESCGKFIRVSLLSSLLCLLCCWNEEGKTPLGFQLRVYLDSLLRDHSHRGVSLLLLLVLLQFLGG